MCIRDRAYRLGDNTAKSMGRLTLNPIKHIDPMGLLMMVLFKFGWAKPVPVNMWNFKNPKRGMAVTALAGPVSNIILSVIALFLYGLLFYFLSDGAVGNAVLDMLYITGYISIFFAIFNIMPIPPLDGSKVLFSFLSDSAYTKLMRYERYGMLILAVIVVTDILPLGGIADFLFNKFFAVAQFAYDIVTKFV